MHASSPGTQADPQMVHALVQLWQASCPSTRTGSTGCRPHIGQSSKIDAFQLKPADGSASRVTPAERTELVQVNTDDRTSRAGTLASVEA
jgi:hypothetical protein